MKDINIKKHAFVLLLLMSGLYFISYFQRVAIPGTIFNELQRDFAASASAVTALGAIYLLVYASMQLFIGMLADRHGGVKITLVCGLLLCIGSLLFPLSDSLWVLYLSRVLVGVGASGMYLCIIKETDTLFSARNFAPLIGLFCMIGYGGGLFGTRPFREIVDVMGWRWALLLMAGVTVIFLVLTYFAGRAFMGNNTVISRKPVLDKIKRVIKNSMAYPVFIAVMINFSLYFSIQATIGPKFIEDFLKLEASQSTKYTFIMMLFTVLMLLISGNLSRWLGNRRKPFLVFGAVNAMIAVGILLAGSIFKFPPACFLLAYVMLAVSGGLGPVIVSFVKELSPCDVSALSIGFMNTFCYVAVAVSANLIGLILDIFKNSAMMVNGTRVYPAEAYITMFTVMLFFSIISVISSLHSRETKGQSIYDASGSASARTPVDI